MTPEPISAHNSTTMPLFRRVGLIALVTGAFALIFGIVRFNSLVSVALRETEDNDPLLWVTLVYGALLTLYGVVTVFGGYHLAQSLRTGHPKALAVASLLCCIC